MTQRLKHRKWFVLLAGVLAVGLLLVAGELTLRVYVWARGWTPNCYAAQLQLFRPHPRLGYDLAPGFRFRSQVFVISTNALGLRGPSLSRAKPVATKRVALLGGSSAFGYLVSDGQEAARILETNLCVSVGNVEVLNGGVPGYNLYQTIERFREVIAPLAPDLVVLYLGWNDLGYVVADDPQAERFRVRPIAPVWERFLGHSTLYGLVAYRLLGAPARLPAADLDGCRPTLCGAEQFFRNLDRLAEAVRDSGARLVVCTQACAAHPEVATDLHAALGAKPPEIESMIALGRWLHGALQQFAEREHAELIDAYAEIAPTTAMLADYIHLTQAGEACLAQLFTHRLAPLLREPDGASRPP